MGRNISHDAAIAAVAFRQYGNITRVQLLQIGLTDDAIAHRVRTGRLQRIYTGVYSVGRRPNVPLERASAAVLACGPGAALSHGSAMTLWGLRKYWPSTFEVVVPGDRRPKGIKVHRSATLTRRDIKRHKGIRVTSPARTLHDTAPRLTDKALRRAVNDALHTYLHQSHLAELLARLPKSAATVRLLPFVANADAGLTRSELEDAFVAFCERFGFPRPETNVPIGRYRADALFRKERLIVELDSYEWHGGREAFESDRDRDADTLLAGYQTVRVTHERMRDRPNKEAARLHALLLALSRASVPDRGSTPRT
jgi:very-short-patch-repair endonuclease